MIYKNSILVVVLVGASSISFGLSMIPATFTIVPNLSVATAASGIENTPQSEEEDITSHEDSPESLRKPAKTFIDMTAADTDIKKSEPTPKRQTKTTSKDTVFNVPFYSQFTDITPIAWRKIGCGIASLAMLIDFYTQDTPPPSVDTLLEEGIAAHAYLQNAGWTYAGLISVSKKYGMTGTSHDLASSNMETAFLELKTALREGPVMVSVHYTFDPQNPIPHLVIANGVRDGMLYYNDPAESGGGGSISVEQFQSAWKKRYIVIRPSV